MQELLGEKLGAGTEGDFGKDILFAIGFRKKNIALQVLYCLLFEEK